MRASGHTNLSACWHGLWDIETRACGGALTGAVEAVVVGSAIVPPDRAADPSKLEMFMRELSQPLVKGAIS